MSLARLDEWAETHDAHVLLTRRLDLSRPTPEEWVCILTWDASGPELPPCQASGYGMSPGTAIGYALAAAEQVDSRPCPRSTTTPPN